MAFGGDNYPGMYLETVTRSFDFSGRARRTELACYWFGCWLAGLLAYFAITHFVSEQAARLVSCGLGFLFLIPMFALFTRRLHDQGRSGWWTFLLALLMALSLPSRLAQASSDFQVRMAHRPSGPWLWLDFALVVALAAFTLAPETIGPNRYGPDPREAA